MTEKTLFKKLKQHLFSLWGFGIICSASILFSTAALTYIQYQQQEAKAYQQSHALSKLLAEQVKHMVKGIETRFSNLVIFIEHLEKQQSSHTIDSIFHLQKQSEPSIMDLLLVDPQGQIISWSGDGERPYIKDRDYIQAHLTNSVTKHLTNSNPLYIGKPLLSRVHQQLWFFGISQAIYNQNQELQYILVAIIDIGFIHQALKATQLPNEGSLAVARKDGYIYSRVPNHQSIVAEKLPVVARIAAQEKNNDKLISPIDLQMRYIGAQSIDKTEIIVFATLNSEHVLAAWRKYTLWLFTLSTALILVILAFIASFSRQREKLTLSYQQQKKLASTDKLTGLHNRRYLQEVAVTEIKYAKLRNTPISIMLIDIDHFKAVNDTYGHVAGDQVLQGLAQHIKAMFRHSDILIRFGGEEFLLLLPNTDPKSTYLLAETLRKEIEGSTEFYEGKTIKFTISIGVSQWFRQEANLEKAIKSADDSLYQAKQTGRNKTVESERMKQGFNSDPRSRYT